MQIRGLKNSHESDAKYKAVFGSNVAWLPGISFYQGLLTNWSLFLVWLVTNPELYFPLGQDLPNSCKERLQGVHLWQTEVSTSSKDFRYPRSMLELSKWN